MELGLPSWKAMISDPQQGLQCYGSGIFIPDPGDPVPIPDLGVKKAPDPKP
jgi:hypothetical protein